MDAAEKRDFAAVIVYILSTAGLGVVGFLLFEWWVVPLIVIAAFACWSLGWLLRKKWLPVWSVQLWMSRNNVDRRYKDSLLLLVPRLKMRQLRDVPSTLGLISFYRHERHYGFDISVLADIIARVQRSSAESLGDEVRFCLQAMYERKDAYWRPAPQSIAGWLARAAKLRSEGVPLDTLLTYFRQVPAEDALSAMENGIPIEYAVHTLIRSSSVSSAWWWAPRCSACR